MSERFQNKYRLDSARLKNWDYGCDASYFITICTIDRENYFGEIQNGKMQVSPAGAIAHALWFEIKNHAKHIELGEFVVMPNHVHGILILDGNCRDVACNFPTETDKNETMSAISPKSNTISTIIRSYKSAVTKYCNRLEIPMAWQPRFYDHIIRNEESFQRITQYIKNNPSNWKEDTFR